MWGELGKRVRVFIFLYFISYWLRIVVGGVKFLGSFGFLCFFDMG